jgi:hypothetical protein
VMSIIEFLRLLEYCACLTANPFATVSTSVSQFRVRNYLLPVPYSRLLIVFLSRYGTASATVPELALRPVLAEAQRRVT